MEKFNQIIKDFFNWVRVLTLTLIVIFLILRFDYPYFGPILIPPMKMLAFFFYRWIIGVLICTGIWMGVEIAYGDTAKNISGIVYFIFRLPSHVGLGILAGLLLLFRPV